MASAKNECPKCRSRFVRLVNETTADLIYQCSTCKHWFKSPKRK